MSKKKTKKVYVSLAELENLKWCRVRTKSPAPGTIEVRLTNTIRTTSDHILPLRPLSDYDPERGKDMK